MSINLPHAYLEYSALNWDPPARWDEGVPGLLIDYNLTAQSNAQKNERTRSHLQWQRNAGANAGPGA